MENYLSLKASAGSGKTFALSLRYICLLFLNAKPSEILCLTFSNKSANEMKQRIGTSLKNLGEDEIFLNQLCKDLNLEKNRILARKSELLDSFLTSDLGIMTIDKFTNKILREFSGYLGINDDFIISNDDLEDLGLKYLRFLKKDKIAYDELLELVKKTNKKVPSLVEIFKTLYYKYEEFAKQNPEQNSKQESKNHKKEFENQILELANELRKNLMKNANLSASGVKALDFKNIKNLIEKTWLEKDALHEYSYFKKVADIQSEEIFIMLKSLLNIYCDEENAEKIKLFLACLKSFTDFRQEYNKKLNILEFFDVTKLTLRLLEDFIDKDFLYFRLDAKYKHILIDEFQDTSILQYKILEPMIEEILSSKQDFKSFFYVGDTKQSIYRFRGGNKELFPFVSQKYSEIKTQILSTNYRSCENLVKFINGLFTKLNNYDYEEQKYIKEGGFIKVLKTQELKDGDFSILEEKINIFIKNNDALNSMAILTFTNKDLIKVYEYLSQKFPKLNFSTATNKLLINQKNISALINLIKYLYYNEDIYKINFNATLGLDETKAIEFDIDLLENSLYKSIKEMADFYKLLDENTLHFLELCKNYANIVDFINQIDKCDMVIEKNSKNSIDILTIYKAKGLEYDTVFLLDRLTKARNTSSFLFSYKNLELNNIFIKSSPKGFKSEVYKKALGLEEKLSLEDKLNTLYVGLTRARNNLFILKLDKSSVFEELNLVPSILGKIQFTKNEEKELKQEEEKLSYTPKILGQQEKSSKTKQITDSGQIYSIKAKVFGLATHFMLELMPDFTSASIDFSFNLMQNKYKNQLDENEEKDIKNRITNLCQNQSFLALIDGAKILKEQAFVYKNEVKIMDLLLEKGKEKDGQEDKQKDTEYFIFDYKTTKEEKPEHQSQVKEYKKAMKDILKSQNIRSFLIYLRKDETIIKELES